ncbi:DUF6545 domain-containing protein [Nocardia abscessus]|uniref:DUF6545 domain-containing protein n=1 Tax=Nocardia abscessus TaxID=120957 RepID=UPI00245604FF|nr:DUF6545 domain-containing protein [Nocardia abscessus]
MIVSALQLAGSGTAADPELARWAAPTFAASALGAALLSVPLLAALRTRLGSDRAGRNCRRLRPLWHDLTAAVPSIVLEPDLPVAESDARLIRMTVEIRDALMHLRHCLPSEAAPGIRPVSRMPGAAGIGQRRQASRMRP